MCQTRLCQPAHILRSRWEKEPDVELNTADPEKAKAFYSNLFQWQLSNVPNAAVPTGTYTTIEVGEGTGCGTEYGRSRESEGILFQFISVATIECAKRGCANRHIYYDRGGRRNRWWN